MAREAKRLSARAIANLRKPGYYADGNGLYLQVSAGGSKSWVFRYMLRGRPREMGLGSESVISLADARLRVLEQRRLLAEGIDPIEARAKRVAQDALTRALSMTFDQCATAYIEAHKSAWKNAKHVSQWTNTLEQYCSPVFGRIAVQDVDTTLVLKALEPIWTTKAETAGRLRGRIENIMDWATVRKLRSGENPARLRGHLDKLLPKIQRRKRIKHHPALPYDGMADFMKELRKQDGDAALALEFLILTLARTGEVIAAEPKEIDYTKKLWVIPGARMKAGKEHRIPLCDRAIEISKSRPEGQFLFAGRNPKKPMSNMAMLQLLERMGRTDITVHGFRTTFRTWAAERTTYPRELCEMALAHNIASDVEKAYQRSDLFEKRRELLETWAAFVCGQSAKVIPIGKKAAKAV